MTESPQIALVPGSSALQLLFNLVRDAQAKFPASLGQLALPEDVKIFRKSYPQVLPEFEHLRISAPDSAEIAHFMCQKMRAQLVWDEGDQQQSLHEYLQREFEPLALKRHEFLGQPGWKPEPVYRGRRYTGDAIPEMGQLLTGEGMISPQAGARLQDHDLLINGEINLSNRKVVVMGAGAEMASTYYWLSAGAEVLWLDTAAPPAHWWEDDELAGYLVWPEHHADLLGQPGEILATIKSFAQGQPVDLALYAYAPGQAREMRLTGAMNGIVDALPSDLIASVTMLVSPTTPSRISDQEIAVQAKNLDQRKLWERACATLGLLGRRPGWSGTGDAAVSNTVVSIQGASYQVAQYIGKVIMAEVWSRIGQMGHADPTPLRVSANTAAITRTRSLDHPVFAAAFGGAAAFGVETLTPRQSRVLNGLLAVADWTSEDSPTPGQVRVHGGIHTLAYELESALWVAAVIGFVRSPRLIKGLFR
ncbi:MAG: hypothetical protein AAF541_21830 [Pseudomonadota bacterium]